MSEVNLTQEWLARDGFVGFRSIGDLRLDLSALSHRPGVYSVLRPPLHRVELLVTSTGGWFKGRNPAVPIEKLRGNWVDRAEILYIGKADAGSKGTRGIRVRVGEYLRFGQGKPIGHWGGRYLWQLAGSDQLLVCWKPCATPSAEEKRLLDLFRAEYGALPFANLKRG